MLPRGTSIEAGRLRRAKSTPLIPSHHLPSSAFHYLNPQEAHQHALTAASIAYEHGNDQITAMNRKSEGLTKEADGRGQAFNLKNLERKRSVRFTGPTALPAKSRSITRRDAPGLIRGEGCDSRIPHFPSSQGGSSLCDTESYLELASQDYEYPENEMTSMPSSYRRLRRARSTLVSRKASSGLLPDKTATGRLEAKSHLNHSSATSDRSFQAQDSARQKPMNFLQKASHGLPFSAEKLASRDAAVQLARDQYLREVEQQRLKSQPSLASLSKISRGKKPFRKTVRTSSSTGYGKAIVSPSAQAPLPSSDRCIGGKARSISTNLKNRLRRVFRSNTSKIVPAQQLEATRLHFRRCQDIDTSPASDAPYQDTYTPDGSTIRRISSQEPVFRKPLEASGQENAGESIHSVTADDMSTGKSRVTSWTDSSIAETVIANAQPERRSLSVIKENESPYKLSHKKALVDTTGNGYSAFRDPLPGRSVSRRFERPIETQRVYSALQKRIQKEPEDFERQGLDSTPKAPSKDRRHPSQNSRHGNTDISKSIPPNKLNPKRWHSPFDSLSSRPLNESPEDTDIMYSHREIAQIHGLERSKENTPLHEVSSALFQSSIRTKGNKTTPYRQTNLSSGDDWLLEAKRNDFDDVNLFQYNDERHPSPVGSESIYSRTTSGDTPGWLGSTMAVSNLRQGPVAGAAVIITSQGGCPRQSQSPLSQPCSSSEKESKSSASAPFVRRKEIEQTNNYKKDGWTQGFSNGSPRMTHQRSEGVSDIDDAEKVKGQPLRAQPPCPIMHGLPLSGLNFDSNSIEKNRHYSTPTHKVARYFPTVSIAENQNAPSIGIFETNETPQDKSSPLSLPLQFEDSKTQSSPTPTVRPQTKFESPLRTEDITPRLTGSAKQAYYRYSPERAARLHRMQSRNLALYRDADGFGQKDKDSQEMYNANKKTGVESSSPLSDRVQGYGRQNLVESFLNVRKGLLNDGAEFHGDTAFI